MTKRAIFFDTETTGIRAERDRIIEIAAFDPRSQQSFVSFVNPSCPIPIEASQIHGITDEMVKDAPSFQTVGAQFVEFCSEEAILIGHNAEAFDRAFLLSEFQRHSLTLPAKWVYLDTLKWSRKYRKDLPRHSLQHLREVYGIPPNQAHRALDDVMVLYNVFKEMIDDLSFETALGLLSENETIHRMPFGKYQGKALKELPKDYIRWLASSGALDKSENSALKRSLEALLAPTPALRS